MSALYHAYELPWSPAPGEQRRLRKITTVVLVVALVLALVVPFLPVSERERTAETLPPRLAELVLEKRQLPPPPPAPEPEPEPQPEPEAEEQPPEPEPEAEPEPPPEPEEKPPEPSAREKAEKAMASIFGDTLNDLREEPAVPPKNTGKLSQGGTRASEEFSRDVLTSGKTSSSGGIDTSNLSSGVGRSSLAGRETRQVESPVESVARAAPQDTETTSSGAKRRSQESITLALASAKGSLYRLYHRALRSDPTLEGKVVFEISIAPSGKVTNVRIVSSELNDAELEQKLLARIKLLDFGAKDVEPITVTAPYDFLPVS